MPFLTFNFYFQKSSCKVSIAVTFHENEFDTHQIKCHPDLHFVTEETEWQKELLREKLFSSFRARCDFCHEFTSEKVCIREEEKWLVAFASEWQNKTRNVSDREKPNLVTSEWNKKLKYSEWSYLFAY